MVFKPKTKWDLECANEACKKDLLKVNPLWGLEDSPKKFCSMKCRNTVTGEKVTSTPAKAPVTEAPAGKVTKGKPSLAPVAAPPKGKALAATKALPDKPGNPSGAPKAQRSINQWSNLEGKIHLTGKTPPKFQGARKQVWELLRDGMLLKDLYAECEKAGLEGKANMAKIIGVYGCAEVR